MSLADKQMYLKELELVLGDFIPANDMQKVLTQVNDTLIAYDIQYVQRAEADADSGDLLKYFLEAKRIEGLTDATLYHYERLLTRLREEVNVPYSRMTVFHVRNYLIQEKERDISPSTLRGYQSVYSSFFGWLDKEGLLQKNPINNLPTIKKPKILRRPFSPVDMAKLMEAAPTQRDKALIAFLRSTGCRISECCAVDRDEIDWQSRSLKVFGKGQKERKVYIDEVTEMMLERYLAERKDERPELFTGRCGRLTPGGVRFMLNQVGDAAGVENVHPHRFRRTLATSLIRAGMPIQEVARILGHEKIDTTMTYLYIDDQDVANSYKKYS